MARCTVERLMRQAGLRGVRRGRRFVTTKPDAAAARPPDLVERALPAPSARTGLWVVDFTYVPTWSGMALHRVRHPTCSPAGSSAGAPRRRCRPSCRWTRWRWRCGSAPAPAQTVDGAGPSHRRRVCSTPRSATPSGSPTPARWPRSASVGDSYDNALAETVIGLYKTEAGPPRRPVARPRRPRAGHPDWVDWFNHVRLYGSSATSRPSSSRPPTTVNPAPDSSRSRENSPSTKPGALHSAAASRRRTCCSSWMPPAAPTQQVSAAWSGAGSAVAAETVHRVR